MVDRVATMRAEAIEQFAAVLRELRASAGSPSFRTMSGRSHAISHTTLHEAARGHRLPSWPTTAEFVKACDADPADFREQWEQANQATRSATTSSDDNGEAVDMSDIGEAAGEPSPPASPPGRRIRKIFLGTALVATLVVAGSVVVGIMATADTPPDRHAPAPRSSATAHALAGHALTAADCPVQQSNPPPAAPPDRGDAGAFIADLTLPDCTHIVRGSTVIKIWRFKNIGTVPWRGYALHRIDIPEQLDQCQTITDVPINDTQPGQIVDIKVTVTAPNSPGFCFVRFKMEDATGRIAFPGDRPVNFQFIVD